MKHWVIEPESLSTTTVDIQLQEAADCLNRGGLVAFPTETVYGLGANAWDDEAVAKIFAAKGRPSDNPLIVHLASMADLSMVTDAHRLSPLVLRAMETFWPGPLTVLVPAHARLAPRVHPGVDTVGVRVPNHPVALELLRLAKCPVAAPSANLSGKPSGTTAEDVLADFHSTLDGVVDGGPCSVGIESTVVQISTGEAIIYRPGGISREELEKVLCIPVSYDPYLERTSSSLQTPAPAAPKSPGMKYRHYAPDAEVHVFVGTPASVQEKMNEFLLRHGGENIAIIASAGEFPGAASVWQPALSEPYVASLARHLYHLLREFDSRGADYILIEGSADVSGVAPAVMNRLHKAAEGRIHRL